MRRSASEVIRELETRIARLERQSALDADVKLARFVSTLESLLGRGIKVTTHLEMTESHGKTYTVFIDPFAGERPTDFFMARGNSYRGYMPTADLKKKVSKVTRSFKNAVKKTEGVEIGLDGQLNSPTMRKDSYGDRFYDASQADYRWELFVYNG